MSPHRIVTAPQLAAPVGFAHAVVADRTVYLGGQTAQGQDGAIIGTTMAEQFDVAAGNVVTTLHQAGSSADQLVSLMIYVTDVAAYKAGLAELGSLWRKHFGRHYPAIALIGVAELFDAEAMIELVGVAVIPESA